MNELLFKSAFTVTASGSLLIRRPIPRDVAKGVVYSARLGDAWDTLLALQSCMDPAAWLDTALWCAGRMEVLPVDALNAIMSSRAFFTAAKVPIGLRNWWDESGDILTVWRGCHEGVNEAGGAFCPDPFYASFYARPALQGDPRPILIEATVPKGDCVAFAEQRRRYTVLALPSSVKVVKKYALPLRDDFYRERVLDVLP